jgi:hypothetical protein
MVLSPYILSFRVTEKYLSGLFGQYEEDNVVVSASNTGVKQVAWTEESAGK